MNLNEAEIAVTTNRLLEEKQEKDYWFELSDYSDMTEFHHACSVCFPEEDDPVYRYPKWENIPDFLVNKEWLCPNFFDLRDALDRLEEPESEYFENWCRYYGYNLTTDDPHVLVSHFQDMTRIPTFGPEDETAEINEDAFCFHSISSNYFDTAQFPFEVFDDNYD